MASRADTRIDPATADIIAPGWFESTELKEDMTTLPKVFNAPFTEVHMKKIEVSSDDLSPSADVKQTVAPMLLPLITRELRHVVRNDAIKRGTDAAKHRAVCGGSLVLPWLIAHARFLLVHNLWRLVLL